MTLNQIQVYIKKQFKMFIICVCGKEFLHIFLNVLFPILLAELIARATTGNINEVLLLSLVIFGIKLIELFVFCIADTVLENTFQKKKHKCKLEFYKYFFDRPMHELFSLKVGDTKEKLNDDFDTIVRKYTSTSPKFITCLVSVVVYFVYLFFLSKWIALFFFAISLIQIVPPILIAKYLQINYDDCRDVEAEITDFVVDGYRAFTLIKLYKLDVWWMKKFAELHKKYARIGRKSIYTGTAESILDDIVSSILTYAVYGVIGVFALNGVVTLEIGIQAIAVSGSVFGLVKSVFDIIKDAAIIHAAELRLSNTTMPVKLQEIHLSKGDIHISNLSFSYDINPVIEHLSISFDDFKVYEIHGENGSGKTTLLHLIAGVLKCEKSEILIDGIPTSALSSANYPSEIFFLPQEDAVFDFTALELYDMILPTRRNDLIALSQKFGLTGDLLRSLKISELSGGERKKVFLSMAFVLDPILMILDEPTNSLDVEGKTMLRKLLKKRERRTLIVTHDNFLNDVIEHTEMIRKGVNCEHT